MLTWSIQKRLIYTLLFLAGISVVVGIPLFLKLYNKPQTCFDNIKNQNEINIDCGGVCMQICREEIVSPHTLFERFIKVAPGFYSAVVVVENTNEDFFATRVPYVMRFYDKENVLLTEVMGETFLYRKESFPIIEYGIETKEREIARMTFEFLGDISWQRGDITKARFEILNKKFSVDRGISKLEATFKNEEVFRMSDVSLVALLYDAENNVMAVSHTKVDVAGKNQVPFVFTWNEQFKKDPVRIDIVARVIPRELDN